MALFVTYAPAGRIKPHVPPYLAALARERVSTTLIVSADHPAAVPYADVIDLVDGLYLRQNQGFDFAAWSHVARGIDFSRTRSLYLINDSVVGPLNAERFSEVMDRIRASSAHLVGLTESLQIERHFQSYFLVAKAEGVAALLSFLFGVKAYGDKHAVIMSYEERERVHRGMERASRARPAVCEGFGVAFREWGLAGSLARPGI